MSQVPQLGRLTQRIVVVSAWAVATSKWLVWSTPPQSAVPRTSEVELTRESTIWRYDEVKLYCLGSPETTGARLPSQISNGVLLECKSTPKLSDLLLVKATISGHEWKEALNGAYRGFGDYSDRRVEHTYVTLRVRKIVDLNRAIYASVQFNSA